jgi:hypothetical protein
VVETPAETTRAPGESGDWDGIEVYCECGHLFRAQKSLKGGVTNCPRCQRAVEVSGGPEAHFWLLLDGGIALVVGLAAVFYAVGSIARAVITLVLGGVVIGICVLAS